MTRTEPEPTTMDCIFENILGFMLPFFLPGAGGDMDRACDAIRELAEAHNVATATELELAGRILGFSTVAMDNLRLSMNPEMSDTKVLRYRSNAVALSRASDQCRKILEAMQANRKPAQPPMTIPAPAVAAAPPPAETPQPPRATANKPSVRSSTSRTATSLPPLDIETMKRDARVMLAAFSNQGGPFAGPATAMPNIADPASLISAAVIRALTAAKLGPPK
jgi:hypothetical protein